MASCTCTVLCVACLMVRAVEASQSVLALVWYYLGMLAIVFQLQFFLLARLVCDVQSRLCGAVAKMKIVLGGWSWSRNPGLPQYGTEWVAHAYWVKRPVRRLTGSASRR